jgi:branched-chain amino acid transport system substrate-binding protein
MFARTMLLAFMAALPLQADETTIKIISSLPRTGSAKGQTDSIVNGIKMALSEAGNKADKFKIEYLDLDDATAIDGRWTAEKESANAEQAIKDKDVMVYIGPYNSGAAAVSMPMLNKADLLMISPSCTWPGLTKPGFDPDEPRKHRPSGKVNFLRVVPTDDHQGHVAAKFAVADLNIKSVYVLDDNEDYGRGLADVFQESGKKLGLKMLGRESIPAKQPDHQTLLKKIQQQKPDAIYFGGTSVSGGPEIARDMAAIGLRSILLLPDGCYEDYFVKTAGEDTFKKLKCYISFGGMPATALLGDAGKRFVKKYSETFKAQLEPYGVYGYEAARIALAAIERAGKKDRDSIRQSALSLKDFETALGKVAFDKNGDISPGHFSMATIEKNELKFLKVINIK